jgi:hypothetical protein
MLKKYSWFTDTSGAFLEAMFCCEHDVQVSCIAADFHFLSSSIIKFLKR